MVVVHFLAKLGANVDVTTRFITRGILDITRFEETMAVLAEFARNPVLGNGLGYQYTYTRSVIDLTWVGGYTHNIVTYVLLTMGLVGVAALLAIGVAISREVLLSLKVIRRSPVRQARALFWGSYYALGATLTYALFQSVFRALGFPLIVSFCLVIILKVRTLSAYDARRASTSEGKL